MNKVKATEYLSKLLKSKTVAVPTLTSIQHQKKSYIATLLVELRHPDVTDVMDLMDFKDTIKFNIESVALYDLPLEIRKSHNNSYLNKLLLGALYA